jgi:hypothetical protein
MRDPRSTSSPSSCDPRQRTPSFPQSSSRIESTDVAYRLCSHYMARLFQASQLPHRFVQRIHLATAPHHLALNNPLGVDLHLVARDS